MKKKPADQYSKRESKERFEAALRGSRAVGPQPMKSPVKKAPKTDSKRSRRAGAAAR